MAVIAWPDRPTPADLEWTKSYPLPAPGNMLRPGPGGLQTWVHQGTRMASQIEDALRVHHERRHAKDFRVLDFGCGNGRVALPLHFRHGLPTACADLDPQCVEYVGRALPDIEVQRPPQRPPTQFASASFDAIYAISVWTHMPAETQRAWVEELARLLRPDGIAIITTSGFAALASRRQRLRDWAHVDDETLRREGQLFKATGKPRGIAVTYGYAAHDPAWVSEHFGGDAFEFVETRERAIENMQDLHVLRRLAMRADTARGLRRDLSAALAAYASGRAGIAAVHGQIERVAQYACGDPHATLTSASPRLESFVKRSRAAFQDAGLAGMAWCDLYDRVRDTAGGVARTAVWTTTAATVLMKVLGDMAARATNGKVKVKDCMVAMRTCADEWQTLADIRRAMLADGHSVLPIRNGNAQTRWRCIRAEDLARHLLRNDAWSTPLGEALGTSGELPLFKAPTVDEDTPIEVLLSADEPRLPAVVTRRSGTELAGIVTALDIL